ncbi:hypothetical protein [Bdellovibrio svalbardensis]|uniref:Uncharacterized protein n=1 Tax=Bdellovibrio svalbardensis TaxID=2972972 RepID=A0ABT6DHU4_9BACT|nr:hypothetical protein [Bdellovibrio svalbardensis]MDG0816431.1 hypothetical protein [Bdellovibrio svalbardensis]
MTNQECIKRAVQAVPEVEYIGQERKTFRCWPDCPKEYFHTYYKVRQNGRYNGANVVVTRKHDDTYIIENLNLLYINANIPQSDIDGYEKALPLVSKSVENICALKSIPSK